MFVCSVLKPSFQRKERDLLFIWLTIVFIFLLESCPISPGLDFAQIGVLESPNAPQNSSSNELRADHKPPLCVCVPSCFFLCLCLCLCVCMCTAMQFALHLFTCQWDRACWRCRLCWTALLGTTSSRRKHRDDARCWEGFWQGNQFCCRAFKWGPLRTCIFDKNQAASFKMVVKVYHVWHAGTMRRLQNYAKSTLL